VRGRNEDSFLVQHLAWSNRDERHELALVVVADGLGACQAGDRASGVVIRTAGETLSALLCGALTGQFQDLDDPLLADPLAHALRQANKAVYHKAQVEPSCKGMGATAAVVLVWDSEVRIAHAGDCRVYHHHAGKLAQVTSDQTLVARMVELGTLTPEEAKTHPARNEVTHAVGKHPTLEPARHRLRLDPGDWLLVCCDGLYAHVDDPTLQALLGQPAPSAAHLAQQLVDLADQGGGTDNCTVVTVHRV
jgi:protein phosphatase